jgi:hypothetical protein
VERPTCQALIPNLGLLKQNLSDLHNFKTFQTGGVKILALNIYLTLSLPTAHTLLGTQTLVHTESYPSSPAEAWIQGTTSCLGLTAKPEPSLARLGSSAFCSHQELPILSPPVTNK